MRDAALCILKDGRNPRSRSVEEEKVSLVKRLYRNESGGLQNQSALSAEGMMVIVRVNRSMVVKSFVQAQDGTLKDLKAQPRLAWQRAH